MIVFRFIFIKIICIWFWIHILWIWMKSKSWVQYFKRCSFITSFACLVPRRGGWIRDCSAHFRHEEAEVQIRGVSGAGRGRGWCVDILLFSVWGGGEDRHGFKWIKPLVLSSPNFSTGSDEKAASGWLLHKHVQILLFC